MDDFLSKLRLAHIETVTPSTLQGGVWLRFSWTCPAVGAASVLAPTIPCLGVALDAWDRFVAHVAAEQMRQRELDAEAVAWKEAERRELPSRLPDGDPA